MNDPEFVREDLGDARPGSWCPCSDSPACEDDMACQEDPPRVPPEEQP